MESEWRMGVWRGGLMQMGFRFAAPLLSNPNYYWCGPWPGYPNAGAYVIVPGGDQHYGPPNPVYGTTTRYPYGYESIIGPDNPV